MASCRQPSHATVETLPPPCRAARYPRPIRRITNVIALTVALYGFAAWAYVAAVALVLPNTLPWQLTHLSKWPRTDTFGELSFVVSFLAFVVYGLTREPSRR